MLNVPAHLQYQSSRSLSRWVNLMRSYVIWVIKVTDFYRKKKNETDVLMNSLRTLPSRQGDWQLEIVGRCERGHFVCLSVWPGSELATCPGLWLTFITLRQQLGKSPEQPVCRWDGGGLSLKEKLLELNTYRVNIIALESWWEFILAKWQILLSSHQQNLHKRRP